MKSHGRRATLKEKKIIASNNLNPDNWHVVKHIKDSIHIINKKTHCKMELTV